MLRALATVLIITYHARKGRYVNYAHSCIHKHTHTVCSLSKPMVPIKDTRTHPLPIEFASYRILLSNIYAYPLNDVKPLSE